MTRIGRLQGEGREGRGREGKGDGIIHASAVLVATLTLIRQHGSAVYVGMAVVVCIP